MLQKYFTFWNVGIKFSFLCSGRPDGLTASPDDGLAAGDNVGDEAPHVLGDAVPLDGLVLEEVDVEVEGAGHGERQVGDLHHHVKPQRPGPLLHRAAIEGENNLVNIGDNPSK